MSNPIIIETDLKDILTKIDNRLERIETKLEILPKIEAEVSQLQEDVKKLEGIETKLDILPKIETEVSQLKEDVKDLKGRANAQIWALIITVIGATIAAIIKFGFFTKI